MDQALDSPLWYHAAALQPRLRPHVRVQRRQSRGERWFLLIDARSGRFHRVTPSAYALVGRLDGRHSLDTLWRHVHHELGSEAPTQSEALQLIAQLRDADLLTVDAAPDLGAMRERREQRVRRQKLSAVNPLAFKVPLFDPSALLDALAPLGRAVFTLPGLLLWLAWMGLAAAAALRAREPLMQAIEAQGSSNAVLWAMWLAYPLVKGLHELGHALAVRAWGGKVREIGLHLMVMTPVPYVDASAATQFPQRRRRVAVGAAGIMVELGLAALAFFVWQASTDARVQQGALAVMLLCGLSTLLFNANPLVRFDGYHMLSDALEMPNLAARARAEGLSLAGRALGLRAADTDTFEPWPTRLGLLAYAGLSTAYRWVVGLGITLFLHEQHPLLALGAASLLLGSQLLLPVWRGLRFLLLDARLARRRGRAWMVAGSAALGLGLALGALPAPQVTLQQGLVWLPEQAILRAGTSGQLDTLLASRGQAVQAGQSIARLHNAELEEEDLSARAQRTRLDVELYQAMLTDPLRAARIRSERDAIDAQLQRLQQHQDELTLKAGLDGTLVLPRHADDPGQFFSQGQPVGYVLTDTPPLVKLALTEAQAARLRQGTRMIEVRLAGDPGRSWEGHLERETPSVTRQLPSAMLGSAQGGPIPTDPADPKGEHTLQAVALVDVRLPAEARAPLGMRAWVRLEHAPEALATQGLRALRQLFLRSLGADS